MGLIFHSFIEGDIKFHPTYKYDNGTNNFDSSEKMRTPSWTDRVMYRGENIELLEYSRGELLISDHKPVRAAFVAQVKN